MDDPSPVPIPCRLALDMSVNNMQDAAIHDALLG